MTPQQIALRIMKLVNREHGIAMRELITANGNLSASTARKKSWSELNPNDGVGCPSSNPYNSDIGSARSRQRKSAQNMDEWRQIQEYCMEKFIGEGA